MEHDAAQNMERLLKIIGDPGKCASCDADVLWVTTKAGKKMPVLPSGIPHWADCPNADKHRRSAKTTNAGV
jgi:hypothetical protein